MYAEGWWWWWRSQLAQNAWRYQLIYLLQAGPHWTQRDIQVSCFLESPVAIWKPMQTWKPRDFMNILSLMNCVEGKSYFLCNGKRHIIISLIPWILAVLWCNKDKFIWVDEEQNWVEIQVSIRKMNIAKTPFYKGEKKNLPSYYVFDPTVFISFFFPQLHGQCLCVGCFFFFFY